MKRVIVLLCVVVLLLGVCACGNDMMEMGGMPILMESPAIEATPEPEYTVEARLIGIALPGRELARWNRDGEALAEQLQSRNYIVKLCYAGEGEIAAQQDQIKDMVDHGCELLVIAAEEEAALWDTLDYAQAHGVPVIAYDRPLNHAGTDYFLSFNNYEVGRMQGSYLLEALDVNNQPGPFRVELFGGAANDGNTDALYAGAMEVLQPYIELGKLVVPSGQTALEDIKMSGWEEELAYARMCELLAPPAAITTESVGTMPAADAATEGEPQNEPPAVQRIDAVLAPNDQLAAGIIRALSEFGYTAADFPLVTGQDCDIEAVQRIINGYQGMSVFKDTRLLAAQTVKVVDTMFSSKPLDMNAVYILPGTEIAINAYYCTPVLTTRSNYETVLLHSSYYTEDELRGPD